MSDVCEWCSDKAIYYIKVTGPRPYARYACYRHKPTILRQAVLDGYEEQDWVEGYTVE